MTKMTKIEMFAQILTHLTDADEIAFIQHEIELTAKKNANRSNKPTKAQVANATLAELLYNAMEAGVAYRVSDLRGIIPEIPADETPQRITGLIKTLRNRGLVYREEKKGVAYFTKI